MTERHKSGAVHFHVLGILTGTPDIRTGLDFEKIAKKDYRSAPEALRDIWAYLRDTLPAYGFGRAELLPVKKTGEAVAAYVSKYIEKNVWNRLPEDAHKKLVRYIGWNGQQLRPNDFSWGSPRATAWRSKTAECAGLIGIESPEMAAAALGPRWAFHMSRIWTKVSDEPVKGLNLDWPTREVLRAEMFRLCPAWALARDACQYQFSEEIREMRLLLAKSAEN